MSVEAERLRSTFSEFFTSREHTLVPSAGLIPHHPRAPMFTNAGMNQFLPYFLGEEAPPFPRATTVQKCVRVRGKHDDIELIGRTTRHGSFFEMLGNFSFGDYFKADAIAYAWELLTDVIGLNPERLWVTVHTSDDEAEALWRGIGFPAERIQRLDEDNFWEMGETGPCGPCSEIAYDRGDAFGHDGGPALGSDERFLEIWNLVFMQFDRQSDGTLEPLPRPNIDTGFGLERVLTVVEEAPSVWETSLLRPIIATAEVATGVTYGKGGEADVALRVLADHARTMAFLVSDGVFASNEGRGYVLRRIIRRAVLRAQQLGGEGLVMPKVIEGVIAEMASAWPQLVRDAGLITTVVAHEEEAFRRTLRQGSALLEEELESGGELSGAVAFRLHDTFGFPIDLTNEIAAQRGVTVDVAGFEAEMELQRARARAGARAGKGDSGLAEAARGVLEEFGPSEFVGYRREEADGRLLAALERPEEAFSNFDGEALPEGAVLLDLYLDRTPFYAEGGGQVGDTGRITAPEGTFRVLDTTVATEGLARHTGYFEQGSIEAGSPVHAAIDAARRQAIRRNHTATHLLHAALRKVLGDHVKQQGSLVAPDRLRFDFSHFAALSAEELAEVTGLVNAEVLENEPVRTYETSRGEAEQSGAMAFFGDKYGEVVRVVETGGVSVELCGGTHVAATGTIGPLRIVSEASIGANTRRIEATTGTASLEGIAVNDALLAEFSEALRASPAELHDALGRLLERERSLEEELKKVRGAQSRDEAKSLAAGAERGVVVARRDALEPAALRDLALAVRDDPAIGAVALVGSPDGEKVALVVATTAGGADARALASEAARLVGGGGGGSPELATAGGRDPSGIDAALSLLRERLGA
ncbi:MAG TPA: alanine--tRNA ligase [Acidimicrobiales bacterium]|nr:alanine--tRNA ligase [Acidimicrobiales bacterium]